MVSCATLIVCPSQLRESEVARNVLQLEIEALRPYHETCQELQQKMDSERTKREKLERDYVSLQEENMVCRRMIESMGGCLALLPEKRTAFTQEQENLIDELQQQV